MIAEAFAIGFLIFLAGLVAALIVSMFKREFAEQKKDEEPGWLVGLISEPYGKPSMAKFQILIFTFVISMSILYIVLKENAFPAEIPDGILILLGISGGTYTAGKLVSSTPNTTRQAELGALKEGKIEETTYQMFGQK